MDWTKYRTKHMTSHLGQTHFKQGQGQDIKGQGHKTVLSWQGTREMAKMEDMEVDNSHDSGIRPDRSLIGKAYGQ